MKRSFTACFLCLLLAVPQSAYAYFTTYTKLEHNTLETADWTPPISSLMFGSRPIMETITNGSFSDGSTGWQTEGDVSFTTSEVEIGKNTNSMLADNTVSQTFPNTSKNLLFEYQVFTTEPLAGFDDPCFAVSINDQKILEINSSDVDESTGWQRFSIELSDIDSSELTLKFAAGNTGDSEHQSWAIVRNVTTNKIVGNATQHFSVNAKDDSGLHSFMQDCSGNIIDIERSVTLQDSEMCPISIWSEDADGNAEQRTVFLTEISTAPSTVSRSITATLEPTGEYALALINIQNDFTSFEVRYAYDIGTAFDEMSLVNFTQENGMFFLDAGQFTETTHFMVRGYDMHHNLHYFTEG